MVLLKSVLESLAIYHMSTTLIHKTVLDKNQSRCVQFFWGKANKKAIYYVKWDKLTVPKMDGGLGLRRLHTINKAMILKAAWKLVSGDKALWVRILQEKYHRSTSFWCSQRN